jgi:UDP-N-acetylglucosamine transferase subunit ALG13
MILVAVGASQFPFDRLLHAVEGLPTREPLVVQHGPSEVRPAGARCLSFVPLETLTELVREARVVVTHAGVGSILLALANGKRPYVVPRLSAFGETVDDHQLESARRFEAAGLVRLVEDPGTIGAAIAAANGDVAPAPSGDVPLVRDLRAYLETAVRRPRSSVPR